MKNTRTPEAYSTVCPYLMVENVEDQIRFLTRVFDARLKEDIKNDKGESQHAEVCLEEVVIMMGKAREAWPAREGMNYVFVADTDETYGKALDAGGRSIMEPGDRDYGLREAGIEDPQGNQWWIAQQLRA